MTEHPMVHPEADPNAAHSIFSPSGSAMWLTCSGSLLACVGAPDDGNEDAAYGTAAHSMAEQWLSAGERPTAMVGWHVDVPSADGNFSIEIDDEMLAFVEQYIDWCNELPGDHYVERRVDFSQLTPLKHQSGTADHFACEPGVLTVTDLKMGKGVAVFAAEDKNDPRAVIGLDEHEGPCRKSPHNIHSRFGGYGPCIYCEEDKPEWKLNGNPQGLLYALGVFYEHDWLYDFQKIVIRICQPRLDTFDVWETTREELLRFAEFVRVRAAAAWIPGAPRTPSAKACRFCKVRFTCAARAAFVENMVDECFETAPKTFDETLMKDVGYRIDEGFYMASSKIPKVATLTTAQIAKLLPFRGTIEGFFADLWHEADKRALAGETIPGMKLAEGRMEREFRNPIVAEKALVKAGLDSFELYSMKFASPAQAEKALIKAGMKRKEAIAIVATLISKAPGRPTLVPEQDTRKAYVNPADEIFERFDD